MMMTGRCGNQNGIIVISLFFLLVADAVVAFVAPRVLSSGTIHTNTVCFAEQKLFTLTLEKPLGMLLEEVEEGAPNGVLVQELVQGGSAFPYRDKLLGLQVANVQGEDVTCITFDDVMERIAVAPSPLKIDFILQEQSEEVVSQPDFEVGTPVTIKVIQDGKSVAVLDAKVGDNLRATLLANNVELYRGLKKKLGNCGGAGQCTFCAVKMLESTDWAPRSDYEETKIGRFKNARLACLTNIQGPATVEVQ